MTAALATPTLLIIISAIIFLILERVRPGRELPNAPGWYGRALLINAGQIAITFSTATVWTKLFGSASLFKLARAADAAARRLHRLVRRHVLLLLVAPHPPHERLVATVPSGASFAGADRGDHLVLQAPGRDPGRLRACGRDDVSAARLLARRRAVVQLLRSDRRVLLSFELQVAALAEVFHPDARAAFGASRARRTPLQFRRHSALGPPVRHLPRHRHFAPACGFPDHNERHLGKMLLFRDVYNYGGEKRSRRRRDKVSSAVRAGRREAQRPPEIAPNSATICRTATSPLPRNPPPIACRINFVGVDFSKGA